MMDRWIPERIRTSNDQEHERALTLLVISGTLVPICGLLVTARLALGMSLAKVIPLIPTCVVLTVSTIIAPGDATAVLGPPGALRGLVYATGATCLYAITATYTMAKQRAIATASIAQERATLANEAKGHFLAAVSHDLRTPMHGILGSTELILQSNLDPDTRQLTQVVLGSAQNLLTLLVESFTTQGLGLGLAITNQIVTRMGAGSKSSPSGGRGPFSTCICQWSMAILLMKIPPFDSSRRFTPMYSLSRTSRLIASS